MRRKITENKEEGICETVRVPDYLKKTKQVRFLEKNSAIGLLTTLIKTKKPIESRKMQIYAIIIEPAVLYTLKREKNIFMEEIKL